MSNVNRIFDLVLPDKQILINLAYVSTIELDRTILRINMAHNNKEMYGNQFVYYYGNSEDALHTYNSIKKAMEQ